MKLSKLLAFTLAFLPISARTQVKITLDNPKATYAVGEIAAIRLSATAAGTGTYDIVFDPRDDKSTLIKGSFTISQQRQDTLVLFTLPRAGAVFFRAFQNNTAATAGIVFAPLSILPLEKEPTDFDAFWSKQKADLAAVPMSPKLTQLNTLPNGSKVFLLELATVSNRKVYGYLAVPPSAKHPAVLQLPPFGNAPTDVEAFITTDFSEKCNAMVLTMSVHNAPPNQTDPNAYKPDDLTKPEGFYNRLMLLAGLRAVEYLTSRDDFNGDLGVCGNSLGAGLAISLAGLTSKITATMAIAPASSEQQGSRFHLASGFPRVNEQAKSLLLDTTVVRQTSKYHDAAYFLKRYKGALMFQTGFVDDVCPAASQLAAFNGFRGSAVLLNLRAFGHNYPTEYWFGRYAFFAQHLKDFKNPFDFKKSFEINAGDDQTVDSLKTVQLKGIVKIDGAAVNLSPIRWEKIEGAGDVTFGNAKNLETTATFSDTGKYVLRLKADYDYQITDVNDVKFYTLVDFISIDIKKKGGKITPTDPEIMGIKVGPNPSVSNFKIRWEKEFHYRNLRVFDSFGYLRLEKTVATDVLNVTFDLAGMPDGAYFIEMENVNGRRIPLQILKIGK